MASSGGIWVPLAQRVLRQALTTGTRAAKVLRNQVASAARSEFEPITVRSSPYSQNHARQPVHPLAFRRQAKSRGGSSKWYSTQSSSASSSSFAGAVRRFFSSSSSSRRYVDRVAFLRSNVGSHAVWKTSGRAPFASTLRPNLTGGALPRTAGGYTLGAGGRAGARYFSHTPAAPAQVVQNVSQAVRAFWVSGQRARFDGTDARGRPQYKAISALEEDLSRKLAVPALPKMAPGAFVDFPLNPTITALSPLAVAAALPFATADKKNAIRTTTLGTEGFLDVLGVDFARALKELSAVMNDLKRLAALGDLPILLEHGTTLRVRFPGVDADTVDRLCDDLGITRGLIGQDPGFDLAVGAYASLQFPFAPDAPGEQQVEHALTSPGGSLRSRQSSKLSASLDDSDSEGYEAYFDELHEANPWLSLEPSSGSGLEADGYESMSPPVPVPSSGAHVSEEFEGLEGVYRFLEECDRYKVRF